jgi:hypothetical protein
MKNILSFFIVTFLLSSCSSLHIEQRKYRKGWYVSNNSNKKKPNTLAATNSSDNQPADLTETVSTFKDSVIEVEPVHSYPEHTQEIKAVTSNTALPLFADVSRALAESAQVKKTERTDRQSGVETKRKQPETVLHPSAHKPLPTIDETRNIAARIHPAVKISAGLILMTVVTFILFLTTPLLWFFAFLFGLALFIAGIIDLVQRHRGTYTPEKAARNLRGSLVAMIALGAVMALIFIVFLILLPFLILFNVD